MTSSNKFNRGDEIRLDSLSGAGPDHSLKVGGVYTVRICNGNTVFLEGHEGSWSADRFSRVHIMPKFTFEIGDLVRQVIPPKPSWEKFDVPDQILEVTGVTEQGIFLSGQKYLVFSADRFVIVGNQSLGEYHKDHSRKDTNPKDAVGTKKPPMSTVSGPVLAEVGLAMLEGARKYGRHNYRVASVRGSVYYDAALRHLMQWWEGEDTDPDSGLPHLTKAIASLAVLRDAIIQDKFVDDRPPRSPQGWLRNMQPQVEGIFEKYPTAAEAFCEIVRGTSYKSTILEEGYPE